MLNPFPIQWLALGAYFILRVIVGLTLYYLAHQHIKHYRKLIDTTNWPLMPKRTLPIQLLIIFELLIAFILIAGAWTQYAAIMLFGMSIKLIWWRNRFTHPSIPSRLFYFLLAGCSISLFITGAGILAFDLPI